MTEVSAYASLSPGAPLVPYSYRLGELGADEVEIAVRYCGLCYSDISMLDNSWEMSRYPLVPGHEIVGEVVATGREVTGLTVGQRVGVGWFSGSCKACGHCGDGDENLCAQARSTIVGRHGGFADRVRCQARWAVPLPDGMELSAAGPLFCGGITVFNPIIQCQVKPTERVGVVGIGGLGHLALQFLSQWGCHVVAFTSTMKKADDARRFGADEVVTSTDVGALSALARSLDFILVTVSASLPWDLYLNALRAKGRLHFVGAVLEPLAIPAFALIGGQRSVMGSALGSPGTVAQMLDFCLERDVAPAVEMYPLSRVNDAIDHLRAGRARYRVVLENDL